VVIVSRSKPSLAHAVEDRGRNDDGPTLTFFREVAPAFIKLRRPGDLEKAVLPGRAHHRAEIVVECGVALGQRAQDRQLVLAVIADGKSVADLGSL
jgi:hypothetical protein